MNNYDSFIYPGTSITLKQVQETEYEILLEFDRVCKKLDIPYQLFAGTLLGAVRHNDFIPWDDDIDICLLRPDFDRFVRECPGVLNNNYFLQTSFTDPKSVVQFAKIRKNGTIYRSAVDNLPDSHTGIWIDIFPLDCTKPGTLSEKWQYFEVTVLYTMITSSVKSRAIRSKRLLKRVVRILFYYLMQLLPKAAIERRLYKVMTRYEGKNTGYVGNYSNGTGWSYKAHVRKVDGFYDTIPMRFHDATFPVPRNYDQILSDTYGNYMEFPPEEKRVPTHGIIEVKLG